MKYTKENLSKNIGKFIKSERIKRKLTQEQLAFNIQVEPKTISRAETGSRFISGKLFAKLINEFKVKPYKFFLFGEVIECETSKDKIEAINEMLNEFDSKTLDLIYRMIKGIK